VPEEPGTTSRTIPAWVWAATVALLLVVIFASWQAQRLSGQLAEMREQVHADRARKLSLEAQRKEYEAIVALLAAPETRAFELQRQDKSLPPVLLYWNEQLGMVISGRKWPPLVPNRSFQLWIVPKKGNPVSAGVFQPDANGRVIKLIRVETPVRISDAVALTISEEPAGGSPQPTTDAIWTGRIK